jgi:hypothetical protein
MRNAITGSLIVVLALAAGAGSTYMAYTFEPRAWGVDDPITEAGHLEPESMTLSYDAEALAEEIDALFEPPACGETFEAKATEANGVTPIASATLRQQPSWMSIDVAATFTTDFEDVVTFLADDQNIVVTRDGVVVSPDLEATYTPSLFRATEGFDTVQAAGLGFSPANLCDVADKFSDFWDTFDWDTATSAERAEADRLATEVHAAHAEFPPGEYAMYVWTPIVMGEPAAIARALAEEGLTELAYLEWNLGWTELASDPRLTKYCTTETDADGQVVGTLCDVPAAVLRDVLARDVPASYIVDVPPALGISAPAVIVVE